MNEIKKRHVIDGNIAFPIYKFSAKWSQDSERKSSNPKDHEGLSEGRIWNFMSTNIILREELSDEELQKKAEEWLQKSFEHKDSNIFNPEILYVKGEFVEHEVWVLTWFQHETFDIGETDEEVLNSFQKYVDRKSKTFDEYGDIYPTLMGAEQRWRWHGVGDSGKYKDATPPPCRCKHCKEQGKIRISH